MRALATSSVFLPSEMSGLPNASRLQAALDHQLERPLGRADRAHAVVDAARAEAQLRDLEAAPLAEEDVVLRHAHVGEAEVHVAVRRVVVAEHVHRAEDLDAGRVHRHEDLRLLEVRRPRPGWSAPCRS